MKYTAEQGKGIQTSDQERCEPKIGEAVCKNEVRSLPHAVYKKSNSKWIKVLNVKAKIVNILEENIGTNVCDYEL